MSVFSYSARTQKGNIIKGTYEAPDKQIVIAALKSKGYIPLEVKEKSQISNLSIFEHKLSVRDIAVFCRQFATIIQAGIPILESLDIIRKQTESKRLKEIISKTYEEVQKGKSLSDSLKEFRKELPPILINMIEAGEVSGALDKVMNKLAVYFETQNKLLKKVKGALTYPLVVSGVAIIDIIVLLWFVVPQFQTMYAGIGAKLPLATRVLLSISNFVVNNIILLIVATIGLVVGTIYYLRTEKAKYFFDRLVFKIPKISVLYQKLIAARFSRTMASLLSAGIPLIKSLEITDKVINNSLMSEYLSRVIEDVTKGNKLSLSISQIPFMPAMAISMVRIGEESGALDSILDKTADIYEEETDAEVANLTTLIEPAIIVVLAVVVGGVVISIVQPMFGMFEIIKNI